MESSSSTTSNKTHNESSDIQIIGQGSYGCIYRPNVGCATKKPESKEHLSKVQRLDRTTRNEIAISKVIRTTIPQYATRFAPIIESCPITLGELTESNVEKCKMMQNQNQNQNQNSSSTPQFVSNKIRFVGKLTLGDYLEKELHSSKKSNQYMKRLVNAHNDLLTSLVELNKAQILHLDLKHNNIMVSQKSGRPIIIDFGLSFQAAHLAMDKYQTLGADQFFGIETPYYPPWCVEINVLSYMSQRLRTTTSILDTSLVTKVIDNKDLEDIHNIVQEFVNKHSFLQNKTIIDESSLTTYKKVLTSWMAEIKGKTWKEAWNYVAKSHATWDNYSICVLFLTELQLAEKLKVAETSSLGKYIILMKQVLLAPPEQRTSPAETQKEMQALFSRVPRKEYKKEMQQQQQTQNQIQKQRAHIKKHRLDTLENEAHVRKKRVATA